MDIIHTPDRESVDWAIANDDPLAVLVAYDRELVIVAGIDDVMEHTILLGKAGFPDPPIDRYCRVVLNRQGADWTFVCPSDYRGIVDRNRRIEAFYDDGVDAIDEATRALGYSVPINIPQRYRRHFDTLGE